MSNRQLANKFAEEIKETYAVDEVKPCWNLTQAKKYGMLSWVPDTVAFACVYHLDSGDVAAVVPIAKKVLFAEHDNTAVLLAVVGRYLINHFEMEKQAEATRVINEVLYNQ